MFCGVELLIEKRGSVKTNMSGARSAGAESRARPQGPECTRPPTLALKIHEQLQALVPAALPSWSHGRRRYGRTAGAVRAETTDARATPPWNKVQPTRSPSHAVTRNRAARTLSAPAAHRLELTRRLEHQTIYGIELIDWLFRRATVRGN
jgi:hypothetical protein